MERRVVLVQCNIIWLHCFLRHCIIWHDSVWKERTALILNVYIQLVNYVAFLCEEVVFIVNFWQVSMNIGIDIFDGP